MRRTSPPFHAERVIQKLDDLAASLADKANDRYIGFSVARHHADQRALPYPGAAKNSHALSPAHT